MLPLCGGIKTSSISVHGVDNVQGLTLISTPFNNKRHSNMFLSLIHVSNIRFSKAKSFHSPVLNFIIIHTPVFVVFANQLLQNLLLTINTKIASSMLFPSNFG
jgi:hypothetical protein